MMHVLASMTNPLLLAVDGVTVGVIAAIVVVGGGVALMRRRGDSA